MTKDLKTRLERLEQRAETDRHTPAEIWLIEGGLARGPAGQLMTVSEFEALPDDKPRRFVEVIKSYERA